MDTVSFVPPSGDDPLQILVLTPTEPYPPDGGWRVVLYNDIKYLAARGHKLTILSLTHNAAATPRDIADIATAEYFLIKNPPKWRQVVGNFGNPLPYTIARHHDERLLARASELVHRREIDVVLVEDVVMGRYARLLKDVRPIPVFLRGHNINTMVARRFYQSRRNPIMRYLAWRQYVKDSRYEAAIFDSFDVVAQISPTDAKQAEEMNHRLACRVVYAGVDLEYFSFAPARQRDPDTIMHVGSLDPITKLPAMMWFYEQVLPRIREKFPRARLELAGHTPDCSLCGAAPTDVIVHGIVPDVRPFLAKGAVFIAPQFVGSGIRIKILNAMATGNAVVATTVAAEGLPVTSGQDIFIADDEQGCADHVCRLLDDFDLREKIGVKARATVESRFGWPRIAEELEMRLRKAMHRVAR